MTCEAVTLPGGARAIVCTGRRRRKRCVCGRPATQLCDWRLGPGKTCDADLCSACSTVPAPDKDLCPRHAAAWREWRANREQGAGPSGSAERNAA